MIFIAPDDAVIVQKSCRIAHIERETLSRYESEDKGGRNGAAYRELKFGTGDVFDRLDEIILQVQTETQVTILAYFLAVTVLRAVNNLVAGHFVTSRDCAGVLHAVLPPVPRR